MVALTDPAVRPYMFHIHSLSSQSLSPNEWFSECSLLRAGTAPLLPTKYIQYGRITADVLSEKNSTDKPGQVCANSEAQKIKNVATLLTPTRW